MTRGNAVVVGATEQTGRVAVQALAQDGWEVTAASLGGGRGDRRGDRRGAGRETETVLPAGPPEGTVGDHPWAIEHPVIHDMAAATRELGYRPVTGYAESLPETVAWLAERLGGREWTDAFPKMARSYGPDGLFDYAAEDAWLERYDHGASRWEGKGRPV